MSWDRVTCVTALQTALQTALGETVTVFAKPPTTLNPPCIVIHRPLEVRYAIAAFGVDDAELSVSCVAAADGEDVVDQLCEVVRSVVQSNPSLSGAVQLVNELTQSNWRNNNLGGVDVCMADVVLHVQM